jgi:hypothetical protein
MSKATVATDVHKSLDVHGNFLAEVAFDSTLCIDDPADFADLLFGELLHPDLWPNLRPLQDELGTVMANAVNVRESDINALVTR